MQAISTLHGDSHDALYIRVRDKLQEAIQQGKFKEGEKLPTEKELCNLFNVSRITVRSALKQLEQSGNITAVHGKGYFVKSTAITDDLHQITSFGETLRRKGYSGYTKVLRFSRFPETHEYDLLLHDPRSGDPCELLLLGYSENTPVVLYRSIIRCAIGMRMEEAARELEKRGEAFSSSDLYKLIGVQPARITQRISAMNADEVVSENLDIPVDSAVLVLDSLVYVENQTLLEFKRGIYRGDKYSFNLQREV